MFWERNIRVLGRVWKNKIIYFFKIENYFTESKNKCWKKNLYNFIQVIKYGFRNKLVFLWKVQKA